MITGAFQVLDGLEERDDLHGRSIVQPHQPQRGQDVADRVRHADDVSAKGFIPKGRRRAAEHGEHGKGFPRVLAQLRRGGAASADSAR